MAESENLTKLEELAVSFSEKYTLTPVQAEEIVKKNYSSAHVMILDYPRLNFDDAFSIICNIRKATRIQN